MSADTRLERDRTRLSRWSPRVRYRLLPWWARVILVVVLARIATTVIVLAFADAQGPNSWTAARPGYFDYANLWDARWYQIVAGWGYPTELPLTDDGHVAENAWAFMPVYPFLVRLVMLFGVPWEIGSVLVSLAAGLGAALVLFRLLSRFLAPDQSLYGVVLFSVAPISPLLQFGYGEALTYLLIATALLLLVDRRYGWLFPVVAVWAFTRPGAIAFALTLLCHLGFRWARRRTEPFPVRDRWLVIGLGLFTAVAGLAWLGIAWAVTGQPTAYLDTELAWRAAYLGYGELVPFTAWFQSGGWWFGQPLGSILVVVLIAGFALVLVSPWVRRLGVDLRFWLASFALYLLAVFFPQSSTFRMLGPLFPLVGALAVPRARWYRIGLVVLSIAGQAVWLWLCWAIVGRDWTPP